MSLAAPESKGPLLRERLRTARLYFVCDARPHGEDPEALLLAALGGGVDIVQLREKELGRAEIERSASTYRRVCDTYSALFIVNDDPDLVRACDADGVHVGKPEEVAAARELLGPDAIIGLSTHGPEELDAANQLPVDYVAVGPIWETPTKPGRAAIGLEPISYAAAHSAHPFFGIGGIDPGNAAQVTAAGAGRLVVVRAIRDTADPRAAAEALRQGWRPVADDSPQKRKQRSPRDRMMEGYAKAEVRNQKAREELEPLGPGERPTVVTIGAVLTGLIAISVIAGYLAGVKVDGKRPEIPQVLAPALIMAVMSYGMWHARYWAVLGFQLVLVLVLFSAFIGLIATASTVAEFAGTTLLLAGSGTLFYFMVKAMARIQMPERRT